MSAKTAQKCRSQARAARKRAKRKPGARRQVVTMTQEGFRQLAAPIAARVAQRNGVPVDVAAVVVETLAEEGAVGLDECGQLASRLPPEKS